MKILLIEFRDPWHPLAGGAERLLWETYTRIAKMGHGVDYLCGARRGAAAEEVRDGIRLVRTGAEPLFNYAAMRWVRRHAREAGYTVVVEGYDKLPFLTPVWLPDIPVVVSVPHLFGGTIFSEASPWVAAYVRGWELVLPRVYRSSYFAALCQSTADELAARGLPKERIEVIPPGVSPLPDAPVQCAARALESHRHTMLYVGRIRKYKGLRTAIDAVRMARARGLDAGLVVAGDGPDRGPLERYAARSGVGGHVRMVGPVSEEEKAGLMRGAAALVYPSCKEGWGLSVLEANSVGTPALASDVPGLRDAVKHGRTGLLYPHGDAGALAEGLIRICTDDAFRRELSRGAIEWASGFCWDRAARQTADLLARAVAGHG